MLEWEQSGDGQPQLIALKGRRRYVARFDGNCFVESSAESNFYGGRKPLAIPSSPGDRNIEFAKRMCEEHASDETHRDAVP